MTAPAPVPRRPAWRYPLTAVAFGLVTLSLAVGAALFGCATWIDPRFGTGQLRAPAPAPWAVAVVQVVFIGAIVGLFALLTGESWHAIQAVMVHGAVP